MRISVVLPAKNEAEGLRTINESPYNIAPESPQRIDVRTASIEGFGRSVPTKRHLPGANLHCVEVAEPISPRRTIKGRAGSTGMIASKGWIPAWSRMHGGPFGG